jgi:diguanylate cyclase (GGDEF)-like protein
MSTRPAPTTVLLGLVAAALVVLAVAVPEHGVTALALAELGGTALVASALLRRRHVSRVGIGLALTLGLLATSSVLLVALGPDNTPARVFILLAQVVGIASMVPRLARKRAASATSRFDLAELVIVIGGSTLAVLQAVALTAASSTWRSPTLAMELTAGGDVVAICIIVWVLLTRTSPSTSTKLIFLGCAAFVSQNLVATVTGVPLGSAEETGQVLGVIGAALVSFGGAHPSLKGLDKKATPPALRSGATRLLVVLPFGATPFVVWVVGDYSPSAALPSALLLFGALVITTASLLRALGLVASAERVAETDALTRLLNRRGLLNHLEHAYSTKKATMVALFDLDDFKHVNDRLGHNGGDMLLTRISSALSRTLSERKVRDAVLARLGGDEFVLALPAGSRHDPAELVLSALSSPFDVSGTTLNVHTSVGVTNLLDAANALDALADADIAMYAAKRRGGDQGAVFSAELREEVLGPRALISDLHLLVEGTDPEKSGDLVVMYQPVVDLATRRPTGVEALVRWDHPTRGLVAPDVFLPLAEEAKLGAQLDEMVLVRALADLKVLDAVGLVLGHVNVNLGRSSLRSLSASRVLAQCEALDVEPHRLLLEITEHDEVSDDIGTAAATELLTLRTAGVSVALDDFGAGYASVGYLWRWPADVIKLDRTLLPRLANQGAAAIHADPTRLLSAVGSLATSLDRVLVAEGVEDEGDLSAALNAGATKGQGWLFGRPLRVADLAAWLREPGHEVLVAAPAALPAQGSAPVQS